MKTATRKLRSPLKWHGGKSYLARRIIALMPEHRVYVEPFIGGGSVLLNKPKSEVEVAGDLNEGLINFWECINCEKVRRIVQTTPYEERYFEIAKARMTLTMTDLRESPPDWAIMFLIRNRFSRGGLGKDFAWSERLRGKSRPDGPVPGDLNAWETIREELPAIARRVDMVEFVVSSAASTIVKHDSPEALIYADPPYLHETRTAKKAYAHEMTAGEHAELLSALMGCRGVVMLSGYRSAMYDNMLAGWTRHEFDMPNHSGQGETKQRRIECLWINR